MSTDVCGLWTGTVIVVWLGALVLVVELARELVRARRERQEP